MITLERRPLFGVIRPRARLLRGREVRDEGVLVREQAQTVPMKGIIRSDRPLYGRELKWPATGSPNVIRRRPNGVGCWNSHAVHMNVGRGAAVQHADLVSRGTGTHTSHPALKHGDIRVSRLGRAHLLTDVILLDGAQSPLFVL